MTACGAKAGVTTTHLAETTCKRCLKTRAMREYLASIVLRMRSGKPVK